MTTNKHILPPEWANTSAVLLSWPHAASDWAYMLDSVQACYINLLTHLTREATVIIVAPDISDVANKIRGFVDLSRVKLCQIPTDDTWARDFGMICTYDGARWRACDFKFNGWGLKFRACHDNLITRHLLSSTLISDTVEYANHLGFVLEGGAIDIDDDGTLITTSECLLSPNRNGNLSQPQIEQYLRDALGCSKVLWIDHGYLEGDDTDSHIDTLARFIPASVSGSGASVRRIVYTACDRPDDVHYQALKDMEQDLMRCTAADGSRYSLIPLPIPEPIYDTDGGRLPATYANFLIVNRCVFMPVYADEHYDSLAVAAMQAALPDYKIYTVDCRALIEQHGSLHCITMQIPHQIIRP